MTNLTKVFFVVSLMFYSVIGFSQNSLHKSPNGLLIQQYLNEAKFKMSKSDIQSLTVTDEYYTKGMDLTLVYVGQQHQGIPIYNAISTIAIKDGQVFNVASRFVSNVATKINTITPVITAQQAIEKVAAYFKLGNPSGLRILSRVKNNYEFSNGSISSREIIPVKLKYVQEGDQLILMYDIEVDVIDSVDAWSVRINATNGEIKKENIHNYTISCAFENPHHDQEHSHQTNETSNYIDLLKSNSHSIKVDGASYKVLQMLSDGSTSGIESPNHGSRALISNPSNSNASPYGWHDINGSAGAEYTNTRGNNVHAYLDLFSDNQIGESPDGGNDLIFDFPFNQNQDPSEYREASITNLFYGNNMAHDVWYQYGFDEAAGNFQENNYGNAGQGSDYVNAELDIGPFNNANMSTQADGINPRMQMYLWRNTNPNRDGNFDNAIIIHEYGHGISTRLAGGPSNSGCLSGEEQAGEGWSDWFALMMTMNPGDVSEKRRGIATYALGQSTTGNGIRLRPYTTDFNINEFTYNNIKSESIPHGVGSVFATTLWDLTWAYIDKYGFSNDLYNGNAGNNKIMQLVLDGLKLQPCGSGFIDLREAILAADRATTGGENTCLIWEIFANRGLGYSANQGDPRDRSDGNQAFDLPEIDIIINKIKDSCGNDAPQIILTNFTNTPVTSIDYEFQIDNEPIQTGVWTGNIESCQRDFLTLDLGTLSKGSHTLKVTTINPPGNKTTKISTNSIGIENQVNTFEDESDELIAYDNNSNESLWERGRAAGELLSDATASGSEVYGTNLNGDTGNNTQSYLVSNCYDLSQLDNSSVEFELAFDIENRYDLLTFQYSLNGGESWSILGTADDPDWFNGNGTPGGDGGDCQNCLGAQWYGLGMSQSSHSSGGINSEMKLYKHSLSNLDRNGSAEESVLFRFVMITDPSVTMEGAIIDNFVIKGDLVLSTQKFEIEDIEIYPNPTSDKITIKSANTLNNAKISIMDITGRILNNISIQTIDATKKTIDFKPFASGVYLINIKDGNRQSSKRIIKN